MNQMFSFCSALVICCFAWLAPTDLLVAQGPNLAWSTNLHARLISVDAQTNLYVNAGGTVYILNSAGIPFQTNVICPLSGIAKRDAAGNYYFGGTFDGTQNFGGITLVGGYTSQGYVPGYPTCFLTKYSNTGTLLWAAKFGAQGYVNTFTDLAVDPDGKVYAAADSHEQDGATVQYFSTTGAPLWTWHEPNTGFLVGESIRLGGATTTNCCLLTIKYQYAVPMRIDNAGTAGAMGAFAMLWNSLQSTNGVPVLDDAGNFYQLGQCFNPTVSPPCTNQLIRLTVPGADLWNKPVPPEAEWALARDPQGNVYGGGTNGLLAKFSSSGDLVWSNIFPQTCIGMVVDSSGNRFVSFANGLIGRLQSDGTPQPPGIVTSPASQEVFVGDNSSLTVNAVGSPTLVYVWRLNGAIVSGATSSTLQLNPVAAINAGTYVVTVTNTLGGATSGPAVLRVKSVEAYSSGQMLNQTNYVFGTPPTITIRSAFSGGSNYYTLDGSTPSQSSTPYTGPFVLGHNSLLRVIGYNSNASASEEADPVNATVYSRHTLSVTTSGSGSVFLNPSGGTYDNTNFVTMNAVPNLGWSFLFWLDDGSGSNPLLTLSMENDRSVVAVFGTNVPALAAPPGSVWSTNLHARLISADAQTNLYVNAGGTVYILNSAGTPFQTNVICPRPGIAKRDAAGNYYFGGAFDGSQNFGGITLVGGWTSQGYIPGYPTCFLTKYSSTGSLLWATNFGAQGYANTFTDLAIDPSGNVYAAADSHEQNGATIQYFTSSGTRLWTWHEPDTGYLVGEAIRLGGATATNCCLLTIKYQYAVPGRIDNAGVEGTMGAFAMIWNSLQSTNGIPVLNDAGNVYQLGRCFNPTVSPPCTNQLIRLTAPGVDLWDKPVPPEAEWALARDSQGNVYGGGTNGLLAKFSSSGDLVWSNNFGQPINGMITDASGNRFISLTDGSVARIGAEGSSFQTAFSISSGTPANVNLALYSQPQKAWTIQVSSNLTTWSSLGIITNNTGGLKFSDPSASKVGTRLYRAVPFP
jgi:hypothetical protein